MTRVPLALLSVLALATSVAAQNRVSPLDAARQHYANADYDGALAVLASASPAPADAVEADRLRAFSLLALGRGGDADAVMARIALADPRWRPGDDQSPRVRIAFGSVRDRVLPAEARRLYDEGRLAFERRAFDEATARFGQALPYVEALALEGWTDMEDLRILTREFLMLSRQMQRPVEPERPALTTTVSPRPVAELAEGIAASTTEAVVIRQDLPPWRLGLGGPGAVFRGAVDVAIDATGRVTEAAMAVPVHPGYDAELLRAARSWRYEPARRGGQPVASRRRVEVELRSR